MRKNEKEINNAKSKNGKLIKVITDRDVFYVLKFKLVPYLLCILKNFLAQNSYMSDYPGSDLKSVIRLPVGIHPLTCSVNFLSDSTLPKLTLIVNLQ